MTFQPSLKITARPAAVAHVPPVVELQARKWNDSTGKEGSWRCGSAVHLSWQSRNAFSASAANLGSDVDQSSGSLGFLDLRDAQSPATRASKVRRKVVQLPLNMVDAQTGTPRLIELEKLLISFFLCSLSASDYRIGAISFPSTCIGFSSHQTSVILGGGWRGTLLATPHFL